MTQPPVTQTPVKQPATVDQTYAQAKQCNAVADHVRETAGAALNEPDDFRSFNAILGACDLAPLPKNLRYSYWDGWGQNNPTEDKLKQIRDKAFGQCMAQKPTRCR